MKNERPGLNDRFLRFAVATEVLIEAYNEIIEEGHPKDPGLAAAAFANVTSMTNALARAGIDALAFSGEDVNKLTRREQVEREKIRLENYPMSSVSLAILRSNED